MTRRPDQDDDADHDLVRAEAPMELAGPEALARIIDQSNREQAASRAQARELIKTLEGVQRSQEYLGEALRDERKKSRGLFVLLLLGPAVAAAGAWYVLRHVDDAKSDVERRVERLAADAQTARAEDAAKLQDGRAAQLAADVDALRRDLDGARESLAAERKHVVDREAALVAADTRSESAKTEIVALESEVKSARARQRTEEQRAELLESKLRAAQADLTAKAAAPPTAATAAPPTSAVPPDSPPTTSTSSLTAPVVVSQAPVAAAEAKAAVAAAPPVADPAAADKARAALNALLKESGDAVRYEFSVVRAVAGRSLLDVVVVGADDQGNVMRSIQAGRAEIVVDSVSKSVVLRFYDGKLLIGTKSAPFFDGTYGLVVRGDPAKWRAAALSFVKSE
jgi:hypothetical protein